LNETLTWHVASEVLPDADTTVLLWVREPDGAEDWVIGWLDGNTWRDSTAMPVAGEVTHWAHGQALLFVCFGIKAQQKPVAL
jgi:hypothetical protein